MIWLNWNGIGTTMPDLERWLGDVEGRHVNEISKAIGPTDWCYACKQTWPCDTITLVRVMRESLRTLDLIQDSVPHYQHATYRQQQEFFPLTSKRVRIGYERIAAIISEKEDTVT